MTVFYITCDMCGKVDLTPNDITLVIDLNQYEFDCPTCGRYHQRQLSPTSVQILRIAGVPEREDGAPGPLTSMEADAFAFALATVHPVEQIQQEAFKYQPPNNR